MREAAEERPWAAQPHDPASQETEDAMWREFMVRWLNSRCRRWMVSPRGRQRSCRRYERDWRRWWSRWKPLRRDIAPRLTPACSGGVILEAAARCGDGGSRWAAVGWRYGGAWCAGAGCGDAGEGAYAWADGDAGREAGRGGGEVVGAVAKVRPLQLSPMRTCSHLVQSLPVGLLDVDAAFEVDAILLDSGGWSALRWRLLC